jgi:hypothetical protein
VYDTLLQLCQGIPNLTNPAILLAGSGFSITQQSAIVGVFATDNLEVLAVKIASYHDRRSWQELQYELVSSDESVLHGRDLPTKERLLSKRVAHPWYRALKAILKDHGFN